ncbi:MAG: DMT family transporter [Rhizobiaceae bacterium]
MKLLHNPKKGLSLGFLGGFALSFDIPLIRLAGSDPYMVMGVRGFALLIVVWAYWRFLADRSAMPKELLRDKNFIIVGTLSGINNIFFVTAVFHTSTANVVFILAFNAMLAALLSWPLTGERPSVATWLAIAATILGVGIIVSGGLGTGNIFGDIMALGCALTLAFSLTITRRSGKDLSLAPAYGGLVSGAFALPMLLWSSTMPSAPVYLLIDAFILVPIAGISLWLAPRFIPAPQVSLFYLLETVLAPLWVWYVFMEVPETNVFIGGSIVVCAIALHGSWELYSARQESRAWVK